MGAGQPEETVGRRLRRLRHERGLSQRELSSRGVSYAYISRIEAGQRRPSVKALRVLATKLAVSAEYLETGFDGVILRVPRDQAESLLGELVTAGHRELAEQALSQLDLSDEEREEMSDALQLLASSAAA